MPNNTSDIYSGHNAVKPKRALISVSDKDGLDQFARSLVKDYGVEILSTGGTYFYLKDLDIPVTEVSDITNFPEMMEGRVKTLHPKIHGGILAKRDVDTHMNAADEHDIPMIDMVVVNLYPFTETVKAGAEFDTCIENIDIGGPALIRAAAKNHAHVTVVTAKQDYEIVLEEMKKYKGEVPHILRRKLAETAFARTAAYDSAIASWFAYQIDDHFPVRTSVYGRLKEVLRYGENPHQEAALYEDDSRRPGVLSASQLQGKALSYNNINDTDAAFELISEMDKNKPAVTIIKHANPCGVAYGETVLDAYQRALACDPVSAFGGIIALNQALDRKTAKAITELFCEVIIAPSVEAEALNILSAKKNLRVLTTGELADPAQKRKVIKSIAGGFLLQDADNGVLQSKDMDVVTDRVPTEEELRDMLFAFKVAKHVKSNAIIYAKDEATVGIGAGQMSRIDSAKIAVSKAQFAAQEIAAKTGEEIPDLLKGSVVASDAFFPFADGLIAAADAGVTAVIQPGGSVRDDEVIEAANERGLAMVFTGMRHFRH